MNESLLRQEMIAAGSTIAGLRMAVARSGNLSCRCGNRHILITASGASLGGLRRGEIVKVELASSGTLFDEADGRTGAPLDATSARPDFMILVYPVIRLAGPYAHTGSGRSLLGAQATPELLERYSLDARVTKDTPPAFLVHGGTDTAVPPENSVLFYLALRRAGVAAELHLYQAGPHGIGLRPGNGPMSDWPKRCAEWMAAKGLI